MMKLTEKHFKEIIVTALKEDAVAHDITSRALIPPQRTVKASILLKEDAVVCGLNIAKAVFKNLNKNLKLASRYSDGTFVRKGTVVLSISGNARAILAAERTALNFLGHLSGISTLTRQFVQKAQDSRAQILDTRKTTPGLRLLEKYAVEKGGGVAHRMDLAGMVLAKDNHKFILGKDFVPGLKTLRKKTKTLIEVEVDSLKELRYIVEAKPDIILLDNMKVSEIKEAVKFIKSDKKTKSIQLEVSGGVRLENVRQIARTGVDRISVGALTHSAKSIDYSLEIMA